jgi:hypothetical protein
VVESPAIAHSAARLSESRSFRIGNHFLIDFGGQLRCPRILK